MDINFVRKINKFIRDKRPYVKNDSFCQIFQAGDLLEIAFMSKQCKNNLCGSCIMCDYGHFESTGSIQDYLDEMRDILKNTKNEIKFLLLCTNGSLLDKYQISTNLLKEILREANDCNIPNIILEVHYRDIDVTKLDLIKSIVKKPLTIEMGLETIDSKYQDAFFMKGIKLDKYENKIKLIQSYGYAVEINLMLGLPFLSAKEQIEDVKQSVMWVVEHNCVPIIFPINIKPFTLLRYIYDKGLYNPVSLWLLIALLDSFETDLLSKIVVAWYGNRVENYSNCIPTIVPTSCEFCSENLTLFFKKFLSTDDPQKRKNFIQELINNVNCNCYDKIVNQISNSCCQFETSYSNFIEILKKSFC